MKVLSFIALFFSITPQVPAEKQDVKTEIKKEVITESQSFIRVNKSSKAHKSFFSFFFFN
ncbi:MAG: hypothetical protein JXQ87_04025 [Bacteroidia bacterium]